MLTNSLKIATLLTLLLLACGSTHRNQGEVIGYNLTKPETMLLLPDTLREISGLTFVDSTSFACIQDENGILFIYDVAENKIKKQYTFNINGDYEGITRVNKTIFVLRSDGTLFEISDYDSENHSLSSHITGIPANNNEGLCYDPDHHQLLIACKGKIGKGKEFKDKRVIYGFDLETKKLTDLPVFDFDLRTIKEFAIKNNINVPTRTKKRGQIIEPIIKFRTSAICIHTITKKLYVLSASDHLLFIFDLKGAIEHIEPLDHELFNKAEGITFFENGDMLITNEWQDKKATLLRFNYKKK